MIQLLRPQLHKIPGRERTVERGRIGGLPHKPHACLPVNGISWRCEAHLGRRLQSRSTGGARAGRRCGSPRHRRISHSVPRSLAVWHTRMRLVIEGAAVQQAPQWERHSTRFFQGGQALYV